MNILVVGDVHGCLHTFKTLVTRYWNSESDLLIQLGDFIDRGNFSAETAMFLRSLQNEYPNKVLILRGNHEQEFIEYVETGKNENWLRRNGYKTIINYQLAGVSLVEEAAWMKNLPLFWENENIFVSHAGISEKAKNPFDPNATDGVLWTRDRLRNLGKIQVVGHTPCSKGLPRYKRKSNSWYIDTGAYLKRNLTGIKLAEKGEVVSIIGIPTDPKDVEKLGNR